MLNSGHKNWKFVFDDFRSWKTFLSYLHNREENGQHFTFSDLWKRWPLMCNEDTNILISRQWITSRLVDRMDLMGSLMIALTNHCCPGLSALANCHQNNWKLNFPCQHSQTPWLSGRSHVCFYGSSHPASWQSMMVLEKNLKLKNAQPLSTQRKVRSYPGFFPFNIFPGYFRHCH